ncbi:MAG: sigma-70 family RNA polymerase sigma factor [Planctomycetota bacterium]
MSARINQYWYQQVDATGAEADCVGLTDREALHEFESAPFSDCFELRRLVRETPESTGLTETLIRASQLGNTEARDLFVERVQPRIRSFARRKLGPGLRRHLDSADVQQEANVQVVRSLDRLEVREKGSVSGWLRVLVHNTILRMNRAADGTPVPAPLIPELCDVLPERPPCRHDSTRIDLALNELEKTHPDYAFALRKRLSGTPLRDIARSLGRVEGAVPMLLVRARLKLRDVLRRRSRDETA